jgi:hypothetical protein
VALQRYADTIAEFQRHPPDAGPEQFGVEKEHIAEEVLKIFGLPLPYPP